MFSLRSAADVADPLSLSNQLRSRRFAFFEQLVEQLPKPIRLLDIGGTEEFWEQRGWTEKDDVDITALNHTSSSSRYSNLRTVSGDAIDLSEYGDQEFDVAFSNSVIEHLFSLENQAKMAAEVQRVARAYWVQTPNFWFPIEPHFHVLGWHWMPAGIRVAIIRRRRCGWRGPYPELDAARATVDEVRLMTSAEMRRLFKGGRIWHERFFGVTKSIVAYDGFG